MKNYLTAFFIFFVASCFGQAPAVPGTTEEEFNYVTKGYKVQTESGLDMKKGYRFDELTKDIELDGFKFNLKQLIREETNQLAALLVVVYSTNSGKTYYLCVPRGNQELIQRYFADLSLWDISISKAYAKITSVYLAEIGSYATELEKNQKK